MLLYSQSQTSSRGETAYTLRLCVAVKRKLQLFFWKKREFYALCVRDIRKSNTFLYTCIYIFTFQPDISMPEVPKCMVWCKDSVCLGFKNKYHIVSMKPNDLPKELFPTGKAYSSQLEIGLTIPSIAIKTNISARFGIM